MVCSACVAGERLSSDAAVLDACRQRGAHPCATLAYIGSHQDSGGARDPLLSPDELVYREYYREGTLKRLGEAGLAVHPINYPDDELDIGPSNPK
jgi:hypothetical protein